MNDKSAITAEMVAAAEMVLALHAYIRLIEPVVQGYQRKILLDMQARPAKELRQFFLTRVVLDETQAYLLGDEDRARFIIECNKAREAAGLLVESPEQCPLLVARNHLIDAEGALLAAMEQHRRLGYLFGPGMVSTITHRTQMLALAVQMLTPHIRDAQSILRDLVKKGMR